MTNEELLQQAKDQISQRRFNMNYKDLSFYQSMWEVCEEACLQVIQSAREEGMHWNPVSELPTPGEQVLLMGFTNSDGKKTIWHCVGFYAGYLQVKVDCDNDEDPADFDQQPEGGEDFLKPGFYEEEETPGGYYDCVYVKRTPSHWQKLTAPGR